MRRAIDLRALAGDFAAFIRDGNGDLFAARVGDQSYSCAAKKGSLKKLWEVALSNSAISFQVRWTGDQTASQGRNGNFTGAECTDLVLANWTHDRVAPEGVIAALRALNSAEAGTTPALEAMAAKPSWRLAASFRSLPASASTSSWAAVPTRPRRA